LSPSQIASQGRSLQGNGRAKPCTGLAARRGMERAGRPGTLSARTLRCACLHHRLTRLAGCTRAPHRHSSQATRLCLVPVFVVLPRALPSVLRTHAIARTAGTARSSAHSNNLSQPRTRRLRVRECDRLFASGGVFGIARAGSCLRQILPMAWSPRQIRCRWRGILASRQILALPLPRRGGDATNCKMPTPPANLAFSRFGVARWICSLG
jgi:hypothetical protein